MGAVVALFPAAGIGLAAGLLEGGAIGAGVGAVAGHVAGGMRKSELKDLGELLDNGTSGLLVVAATDCRSKSGCRHHSGKEACQSPVASRHRRAQE